MILQRRQFHALPWHERYEPDPNSGCWLWLGSINRSGYGMLNVKGWPFIASRAFHVLHIGPIPEGHEVCHRCDTPCCVNPGHLFAGTKSDNQRDAVRKGRNRQPRGENNTFAVLTEKQVLQIYSDTRHQRLIAADFNVHRTTVNLVQSGKKWGWLTKDRPRVVRGMGPWREGRDRLIHPY